MTEKEEKNETKNSNNIDSKPLSLSIDKRKKIYKKVINSICKIIINDIDKGYGFFCQIPNRKIDDKKDKIQVLITSTRTLSLEYIKSNKYLELLLNEGKSKKKLELNDDRIYYINEKLNLTFIEINSDFDSIDKKYFIKLDKNIYEKDLNNIYKNNTIYTIESPHFKTDYIYISNIKEINNNFLSYESRTIFKCYCTPIFNLENNKILAINLDENYLYDNTINNSLCFNNIINEFINRNEITLVMEISLIKTKKINYDKIFIINEEFNKENKEQIIDKDNTDIYINGKKSEFNFYFKPENEGVNIIKINFNQNNLINCYKLFYRIKYLTKIDLSSLNTEKITNMSYMLSDCVNLTNINISHLNVENVTDMSYLFNNCEKINKINLSSFKTKNVLNMESMFNLCVNLSEINFNNFNTKNVVNMNSIFKECNSLKNLDISSFEFNKVVYLNNIFDSCINLTNLKFDKKINTENLINMEKMFYDCQSLENINDIINLFTTSKVTNMSYLFYGCKQLKKICFKNIETKNVTDMSKMFFGCKNLYEIIFNEKFVTKKVKNMNQMFAYCSNLIELNLTQFDTINVENMGEMFSFCSGLTKINFGIFNMKKVKTMNKMFYNCNSLYKINLDFSQCEKNIDMNNIFSNCFNLHFMNLNSLDSKKVKNINTISLFNNCLNLLAIYLKKEAKFDLESAVNNVTVKIREYNGY